MTKDQKYTQVCELVDTLEDARSQAMDLGFIKIEHILDTLYSTASKWLDEHADWDDNIENV
jgi:hypothetical protein